MEPKFFRNGKEFRNWLQKNYQTKTELIVGYYKTSSGKPSITWPESVDQALCFGWIDGRRTSIDESSYQIRFTPRKPSSIWSKVNIQKVKELTEAGLMTEAGLAAFEKRSESKSAVYSFEKEPGELPLEMKKQFKANKKAWKYFEGLAPSYRRTSIHWVTSAKGEATRQRRLQQLINDSEKGTNAWKDNKYRK